MKYRQLGNSGIMVSEIGFGAWGIGGVVRDSQAYGPTDDKISQRALITAYEAGVTFFDTAALYGYGHSEELIGNTLNGVRDRIIISTKAGYVNFNGVQDFSSNYLRSSLEGSLSRLKTDYVDIFQLHDPPMDLLIRDDSIMTSLDKFKAEGKIRIIGISTRSPMDSLMAVKRFGFQSVQANFNLVDQRAKEINLFSACRSNGVGLIVRTPLCFGFLTGKYAACDDYTQGDHRRCWNTEQIKLWNGAHKLFKSGLTSEEDNSNAQIALRYVLSFNEISTTIPGMLTDEHVVENVAASDLGPFSDMVIDAFSKIYEKRTFYCN